MRIKNDITKKIARRVGNYNFEVGILNNEKKRLAKTGSSKSFAGMKISASGKTSKDKSLVEVAGILEKYYFKWLRAPFKLAQNEDVGRVVKEMSRQIFGKSSIDNKKLENAVQAVIRNPILRGDYGNNKQSVIKRKGFDKLGISTGQFFKAIKAKRI